MANITTPAISKELLVAVTGGNAYGHHAEHAKMLGPE
jgi:hypothetical protein